MQKTQRKFNPEYLLLKTSLLQSHSKDMTMGSAKKTEETIPSVTEIKIFLKIGGKYILSSSMAFLLRSLAFSFSFLLSYKQKVVLDRKPPLSGEWQNKSICLLLS